MTSDVDRNHHHVLIGVVGVAALAALTWAGGALTTLETHGALPHAGLTAGLRSLRHPSDPAAAWHQPIGPPLTYWGNVGVVLLAALTAGGYLWTRRGAGQQAARDGFASSRAVRAAAGPRALAARAAILRPTRPGAQASELGIPLGRHHGTQCWASIEDSLVILGPPRSGKGLHLVIPSILDSPGSVITTSTRPDNLRATLSARQRRGPVAVFDPQGLAGPHEPTMRWSPLSGCANPATAMARARVLCTGHANGIENASFWAQQATTAVQCLLHAGALSGRDAATLYAWSLSPVAADEAAFVLRHDHRAVPTWSTALDTILTSDSRQRDSIWAVVSTVFAGCADPNVLAAITPQAGQEFDTRTFLVAGGTLYLLGTASGARATASLVNALIEDVVETARTLAATAPGGRLDPPLAIVLDEAANYPLPSLLSLMSEGGGSGISTQVVLQSLAQARATWGAEEAAAVWDAAITKIVLGGSANAADLRDLSTLAGSRADTVLSRTQDANGRHSTSTSTQDKSVLDVGLLRTLPFGHALLLLRALPPARITLQPWTTRRAPTQNRR